MFKRILVPLDGSKLAERAILHAEKFARIFGSTIVLLQVLEPTSYRENPNPVDPLSWQIRKTEADMYLRGIAKRIRENLNGEMIAPDSEEKSFTAKDKICVECSILEGKPADNILNFAKAEEIDLLIISTHGSGGLSRWNIGSVTQKVINSIYLPVLVVRTQGSRQPEQDHVSYQRILLPIDSSRRAECSIAAAIALARGEKSEDIIGEGESQPERTTSTVLSKLILAAVIKPPEIPLLEPYPVEIEKLSKRMMVISHQAVANYLNEMKERLPVESEICIVENKSVAWAIQELANEEQNIDLVVLCAHGYTGQANWPYGTIARNYLEHGTKPVLVIQDVQLPQIQQSSAAVFSEKNKGR